MAYNPAKVGNSTGLSRFAPGNLPPRTRGRTWMAIRSSVLRYKPLCVVCKTKGLVSRAEEVDHIIPLHKGGTDSYENLQGLCKDCHDEKTRLDCGYNPRPRVGLDGWPEQ